MANSATKTKEVLQTEVGIKTLQAKQPAVATQTDQAKNEDTVTQTYQAKKNKSRPRLKKFGNRSSDSNLQNQPVSISANVREVP